MNKTLLFSILCNSFILLFTYTPSQALTDIEKMKVFYKYDSMFFFGDKEQHLDVELGDPNLKKNTDMLDVEYNLIAKEYLKVLTTFIDKNLGFIEKYCKDSFKKLPTEYYKEQDQIFIDLIKKELFNLKNIIRCMFAIEDIQYIEVAKELGAGNYAKTLFHNEIDDVYWRDILYGEYPYDKLKEKHTNAAGTMKYEYWFYESNLKIRIVKQVRDKNGNYLGEIYTDYYKLDQYDKLFDEKGNPRILKKK